MRMRVSKTFILAYQEDTRELERALAEEGMPAEVLRPTYSDEELSYSRAVRCLLNHASAWERAMSEPGLTLIMEADFVPCVGFADLPLPFDPDRYDGAAWGYLYTSGPRVFKVFDDGTMQGHSAGAVAYVVTPRVAGWLTDYVQRELTQDVDLAEYSLWDTKFQWYVMGRGGRCFMPYRSYGEHGGLGNPEHRQARTGLVNRVPWLGKLGLDLWFDRADALYAPLKFMPPHVSGSRRRLWRVRAQAKLVAWLRLVSGRTVAFQPSVPLSRREKIQAYWACVRRLSGFYRPASATA